MKLNVYNRKSSLLLAAVLLLIGAVAVIVPRHTSTTVEAQVGFSNSSLRGTYVLSQLFQGGTGGAFAILTLDGRGTLTGTNTAANVPGPPDQTGRGTRIVFPPFPLNGTYTVNANGSGTATTVAPLPDGSMLRNEFDFVITEHSLLLGVVTEAHAMARGPQGATGDFSGIVVIKRLY